MFQVSIDGYSLKVGYGVPPASLGVAKQHARLVDELRRHRTRGHAVFDRRRAIRQRMAVSRRAEYEHGLDAGLSRLLIVPETERLFVGAGERLLAYDLRTPKRLWEDAADTGFWSWARRADVVVMSAELEIAAWNLEGRKLWSSFVEPPWEYRVEGGLVRLDVMGTRSAFDLYSGPAEAS